MPSQSQGSYILAQQVKDWIGQCQIGKMFETANLKETMINHEVPDRPWAKMGGGKSGLQSAFNHSWSYHRLQAGFSGVCRCMRVS